MPSKVIIIDYGSQVTQLIARRVREAGVYSEIHPCVVTAAQVKAMQPSAIILSGGPASVGEKDAPALDKGFLDLGVPVLGICYGMQLLAFNLGGGLEQSETREYGPADLRFVRSCALWDGIDLTKLSRVWMSHGDTVKTPPAGFLVTGSTDTLEVAAWPTRPARSTPSVPPRSAPLRGRRHHAPQLPVQDRQDHPGLDHVFLCGARDQRSARNRGRRACGLRALRRCGLHRGRRASAQGPSAKNLHCIFVDNGVLRSGEGDEVVTYLREHFDLNLKLVNAQDRFLDLLAGVEDREEAQDHRPYLHRRLR